jgi:O-antigen/teichoic acid export membrane protein
MGLRRKLLGGGGLIIGGQLLGQVCSFGRNIIVARLLTPEDFGVAATLGIVMSLFEMISNLAVDQLLIQAEDGDKPVFQATAHAFQVVRGMGIGLFVFLLAWPLSRLFDIPEALWALQCVALVPIIRGFMHLDPKRTQREYGFGRDVAAELIPQVVLVLAAWPIAWWLKDYSAMLWLMILQVTVMVFVSHITAERRYSWAWDCQIIERMYAFGWPLLLNGLIMFLIFQGDRLVIGSAYNMTQLGLYSAAFTITFVPYVMITKAVSSLLLPLLSKVQDDSRKFAEYYAIAVCLLCTVGIAVATGFIFLGQRVVTLAYGANYAGVGGYIGWLGTMQSIRMLRVGPTIASMAGGDTRAPLLSNIGRISVFPIAIWMGLTGMPLAWIVVMACLGDCLALLMIIRRLSRSQGMRVGLAVKPAMIGAGAIAVAFTIASSGGTTQPWAASILMLLLIVMGASICMVYFNSSCRAGLLLLLQVPTHYVKHK